MPSTCQATVFYDEVGEASARLYALAAPTIDDRLLTVDELAECRFDCRVEGPTCRYSTTLQSRITLKHRGVTTWGDIPAVMAEGILPDPCPWSTELPFLYRVVGTVRLGERAVAEIDQTFGIRPLSTVRNRIILNGKTWVPRGIGCVLKPTPLDVWRDAYAVRMNGRNDQVLQEASEVGVICGVFLDGDVSTKLKFARQMSRYPAVALLDVECVETDALLLAARNTLFTSPWAEETADDAAQIRQVVHLPPDTFLHWPQNVLKPLTVKRPGSICESVAEARAGCDLLQREMAGKGDPAGYFV